VLLAAIEKNAVNAIFAKYLIHWCDLAHKRVFGNHTRKGQPDTSSAQAFSQAIEIALMTPQM
jgi:hypothetical protein